MLERFDKVTAAIECRAAMTGPYDGQNYGLIGQYVSDTMYNQNIKHVPALLDLFDDSG